MKMNPAPLHRVTKITAAVLILATFSSATIPSQKAHNDSLIKMYIGYTPSHEPLVQNWFLPSLKVDPGIELVVTKWKEQTCQSARYYSKGWRETVVRKFDLLTRATQENWGKVFIYSDVDVQFFKPFACRAIECLGDQDVVLQRNRKTGQLCTGFIVCRGNSKTLELWQKGKELVLTGKAESDQPAVNMILRNSSKPSPVRWGYLPWEEFFGVGVVCPERWSPGEPLKVPEPIRVHHANFAVGIPNKIEQFKLVKRTVEARVRS